MFKQFLKKEKNCSHTNHVPNHTKVHSSEYIIYFERFNPNNVILKIVDTCVYAIDNLGI